MDGSETRRPGAEGKAAADRPEPGRQVRSAFGRFTRQEAILGLAALGLFYWGSVATLVGYRLDRTATVAVRCGTTSGVPRTPRSVRMRRLPREVQRMDPAWVFAEPAWAPYPQPRALGLARGLSDVIVLDHAP
jgi:hypothetical protein